MAKNEYTDDGIALYYRNGKKKPQDQIDYERRVKKSNQRVKDDGIIETIADFTPIGTMKAIDKGYTTGDWTDAGIEAGMGLLGPLAGAAVKTGAKAVSKALGNRAMREGLKRGLGGAKDMRGPLRKAVDMNTLRHATQGPGTAFFGKDLKESMALLDSAKDSMTPSTYNKIKNSIKSTFDNLKEMKRKASHPTRGGGAQKKMDGLRKQLGDDWENIVRDMELEAEIPELQLGTDYPGATAIKGATEGTARQQHPRWYKNYRLNETGENIHALYGDTAGNTMTPVNVFGGTGEELARGKPRRVRRGNEVVEQLEAPTITGASRPTAYDYELVGQASDPTWKGPVIKASERISPEMVTKADDVLAGPLAKPDPVQVYNQTPGPITPTAVPGLRASGVDDRQVIGALLRRDVPLEEISERTGMSITQLRKLRAANQKAMGAGQAPLYNRGGRIGPLGG